MANQAASFTIKGSNMHELQVHLVRADLLAHGVVRQDGAGMAAASCLNYGQAVRVG